MGHQKPLKLDPIASPPPSVPKVRSMRKAVRKLTFIQRIEDAAEPKHGSSLQSNNPRQSASGRQSSQIENESTGRHSHSKRKNTISTLTKKLEDILNEKCKIKNNIKKELYGQVAGEAFRL